MAETYFAYGSNMSFKQMKYICPSSKFIKRGFLPNHELVFDGHSLTRRGPTANVKEMRGERVWGGIFEIDDECIKILDRREGTKKGAYYSIHLDITDDEGQQNFCLAYVGSDKREVGKPPDSYLDIVRRGANDCALPSDYIAKYL